MGVKISELPTRTILLSEDLLVLANDAEDMNYKISLADLKAHIGGLDMADLTTIIDEVGSVTYIGKALPGTLTSSPNWKVQRITDLGNGDLEIKWADSAAFSQIWDNRISLIYA